MRYFESNPDAVSSTAEPNQPVAAVEDAVKPSTPAQQPDASAAVTGPDSQETPAESKSWGDDWRVRAARGDEDTAKWLGRYGSVEAVVDALKNAQKHISQGLKPSVAPPEGADDATVQKWRQEAGIPESAEGYSEHLDGLVVGDDDKPLVNEFFNLAHESNLPPAAVKKVLDWYYQGVEKTQQAHQEYVKKFESDAEAELRREWGSDYEPNLNLIEGLLDLGGSDVKGLFDSSYTAEGVPLLSHPTVGRFLRQLSGELNPQGIVVPSGGQSSGASVESRIAEIEHIMHTERSRYNRDESLQAELRTLYGRREQLRARA